jgi:hypothetical protein
VKIIHLFLRYTQRDFYKCGVFVQTSDVNSKLYLIRCVFTVGTSSSSESQLAILNSTFVVNKNGLVVIEEGSVRNMVGISEEASLFEYSCESDESSFIINNLVVERSPEFLIIPRGIIFVETLGNDNKAGHLSISNSKFTNIDGVVVVIKGNEYGSVGDTSYLSSIYIDNVVFSNVFSSGNGSAICVELKRTGSNVPVDYTYTVVNSSFELCKAEKGGAVYISGVLVEFHLCSFINNDISSGGDGRSIFVENTNEFHFVYDPKVNFVLCCVSSDIPYLPESHFYLKGYSTSAYFTTACLNSSAVDIVLFNSSSSSCTLSKCDDLFELAKYGHSLHGRTIVLETNASNAALKTVNLGDRNIGIKNPSSESRHITAYSSIEVLFSISSGIIRVENIIFKLPANLTFFSISSSGAVSLTNCIIENNSSVTFVKKPFIETLDLASDSVIYIKDSLISDYLASSSPLINIKNGSTLYLSNILFNSPNVDVQYTEVGVSAYLIGSDENLSNFFKVEIRNSVFENGNIRHSESGSKGYIDVSSDSSYIFRYTSFVLSTSVFENIAVDDNVSEGGIIKVRNFNKVNLTECSFYNSGGANHGGVFYFELCERVEIIDCNFSNTYTSVPYTHPVFYAAGGAIYGVLEEENSVLIKDSKFNNSKAPQGYGGAIYLKFEESMSGAYEFNTLKFYDNEALKGTNILIDGYSLTEKISSIYFVGIDIGIFPSSRILELFGYERTSEVYFPLILYLKNVLDYDSDFNIIFVSGSSLDCEMYGFSDIMEASCQSLEDAIEEGSWDDFSLQIRILDAAEMNTCVTVSKVPIRS